MSETSRVTSPYPASKNSHWGETLSMKRMWKGFPASLVSSSISENPCWRQTLELYIEGGTLHSVRNLRDIRKFISFLKINENSLHLFIYLF